MIPPLRFVPDSPAPEPRKWNGGICTLGRSICAVHDDGERVDCGILLSIEPDGTIERVCGVDPSLGFQLDDRGRIMLAASDPLMQPRVGRQRCEFRLPRKGEWFWAYHKWVQATDDWKDTHRIVAVGATSAPAYPPDCEPVDAPAATVDGMTAEQLDECLALLHWIECGDLDMNAPSPPETCDDEERRAALTAPAYARWLERQKGASK